MVSIGISLYVAYIFTSNLGFVIVYVSKVDLENISSCGNLKIFPKFPSKFEIFPRSTLKTKSKFEYWSGALDFD